jgi:hypothetical protein
MTSAPDPRAVPTIADVVARMDALSARWPRTDGVRAFNEMYLETTRQVATALAGRTFTDREFIDRLDVRFADLYFDALEAHEQDPGSAPRCWSVLIEARHNPGTHPLQFALVGMNAHITYDLPRALVATVQEFGGDLEDAGLREDFLAVNGVLAHTQPIVKEVLLSGATAAMDEAMGDLDDRIGMWAIEGAREAAWLSARALWVLGDSPMRRRYEQGLDRMVEASSRMLLWRD